jgi:hypothetical protein
MSETVLLLAALRLCDIRDTASSTDELDDEISQSLFVEFITRLSYGY